MAEKETVREDENSDQFNSMLSAAQKHVGTHEGGSGLTQAQIEAMLADDDDEDSDEDTTESTDSSGEISYASAPDEDSDIAERFREGITADAQEAAAEVEEKKKKEKKPKVKKEKKPLDKAQIAKLLTAAAVIISLVLGYLVCLVFFTDVFKTPEQDFAIKAAVSVESKLAPGTEMYVYKAFVRSSASADECMLYAVIIDDEKEKTDMYHVVIYKDDPNKINVYYTIDTESREFLTLHNSDDPEDRIYASTLKSYSDAITAADKEIQIGSPSWTKIDCTIINKAMKKPEESSGKESKSN